MGLDQHRAQIAAEWIDTVTGEVSRARIVPGDRAAVRAFFEPFRGAGLEVALEATTGWRFVVEELQRVGAEVHLAEAAEASALKGKKRRAKTDFADARHLRELLLIGRIPESWISPAHILDLRARVRTRHLLSHQRTEWQQRMHAVLYHHGIPQRRDLLNHASREWLAEVELPAAAREQLEIALHVINAIEQRLVPFDRELHQIAKSQPGCRTLMQEIYGVGALTSVTMLAELGDVRRFQNSRDVVRYGGMDITVYQSDAHRAPGISRAKARPRCAGRSMKPRNAPGSPPVPRPRVLRAARRQDRRQPRVPCPRAQAAQTLLPPPQEPRRPGARASRLTLSGGKPENTR
jgi:transposase